MPDITVPSGLEKILLFCADPAVAPPSGTGQVYRADNVESARRLYQRESPDVVVMDAPAADALLSEISSQDNAPPVIVLGTGERPAAFASLSSVAELPAWLAAAARFRRLQLENKLIREETNRIHTRLLTSYGESEEKYRALINDASEAIFLVEIDTRRILEVNRKAGELTGIPPAELTRRRVTDLLVSDEEPSLEQTFDAAAGAENLVRHNISLCRNDGQRLSVDLSASRVSYAGHEVLQCICHDVTDRKRLEAQLRRQAEELERLVDERTRALQASNDHLVQQEKMAALGALVAGIAHDMHTPIGTITSNSDILSRSLARLRELIAGAHCPDSFRNNPDLKRVVNIVEEISRVNQLASDRIIGIVRSLRNFARLDEASVQKANIHEGLDSTLTLVHHELKNRIAVQRQYGDIPQIECHPNQLNQVFMNILVNAAHAIQAAGTISISTFRDGDKVKIQIADSGTGIKPENLSRIFEPGFTTKGVGVGTGLGLAICYKIVQDHKGRIDVESELGKGTTFTITLPIEWKTS